MRLKFHNSNHEVYEMEYEQGRLLPVVSSTSISSTPVTSPMYETRSLNICSCGRWKRAEDEKCIYCEYIKKDTTEKKAEPKVKGEFLDEYVEEIG